MQTEVFTPPTAGRTFRDPAGSVELRPDGAYRFIQPAFEAEMLEFLETPLAKRLVAEGRLVGSEIVSRDPLVLRHPLIAFPSYPWEWSPALWLAAAELTLSLCRDLLAEGWILKDGTPLNVLFRGTQPVFVDVLSVARVDRTQPIWYAYGQFVRTFLLPVIANAQLGWPLRAVMAKRDGYEPEDLYSLLSATARVQQPVLAAITLPSLLGKMRSAPGKGAAQAAPRKGDPELVEHILRGTFDKLLKQMRRAMPATRESKWTAYSGTATHYSEADHVKKRAFVVEALGNVRPRRVLDVGCNAGVYSELATEAGAEVVALDTDQQTVDRLCTRLKGSGKAILPLVADLANPSPGVGWRNRESKSFLDRCAGTFDGLLMLAVIHHLLLHDHIPMSEVAELCASLTTNLMILEWVPPTDVMFRELVRGRDDIFASITEESFRETFGQHFTIRSEHKLENGRILFHFEKSSAA